MSTADDASTGTSRLMQLFAHYRERDFLLIEPGGNPGDALIYQGARTLADHVGVHHASVSHDTWAADDRAPRDVLYLHGSGGFNPWWSGTPMRVLEQAARIHRGVLIIGPSTFYNDARFLRQRVVRPLRQASCERVFVFARERVSYAALADTLPGDVELMLDHDTALHVAASDLGAVPRTVPWGLYGIRHDKETWVIRKPHPFLFWIDPAAHTSTLAEWINLHAAVTHVVTNRLHSAIISTILGKETTLLPNSYYKNRAVWEYSLAQRGVGWADRIPEARLGLLRHFSFLQGTLVDSLFEKAVHRYWEGAIN